jgi:hypothetical protein
MTLIVINAVSVVCAIIMAVTSLQLYYLTRSTGVLILFIGCLYLSVVRMLIASAETFFTDSPVLGYRSYLIVAFWPIMAAGFILLLRSLRSLYGNGFTHRSKYAGPDRRKRTP